jgi:predicted pyridoxine 5'-phosphate oxidase superfamily flavin-nucleotide-binding protein
MIAPAPTGIAFPSDIAFTPAVKAIQARKGSRAVYERMENGEGWQTAITDDLAALIAAQTSFLLATANLEGQPYVQHRGGPPGFLHVIDDKTLGSHLQNCRSKVDARGVADWCRSGRDSAYLMLLVAATFGRV